MITWSDLQSPDRRMYRSLIVQSRYSQRLVELQSIGLSSEEYIRQHVLLDHNLVLIRNEFPYDVSPTIEHWVLWVAPPIELLLDAARELVLEVFGISSEDLIIFENSFREKSVPGLLHYHVFVRTSVS